MAEIAVQQRGRKRPAAPRIDFTPLVDLGFLLITFFIYTTTLANQKAITINAPGQTNPDAGCPKIPAESTVILIPVASHRFAAYDGTATPKDMKVYDAAGIRRLLEQKKKNVAGLPATYSRAAHNVSVLIKPSALCTYGDVVGLLDEMNISEIPFYSIMDISPEEAACAALPGAATKP